MAAAGAGDAGLAAYLEDNNILIAASDGQLEAVKAYVEAGVPINTQDESGYSPIHAAASYGNTEVLRWLLENGADVTLTDGDGDTALHVCEEPECAELLVAKGLSITVANAAGLTPYENAVHECYDDMAAWLKTQLIAAGLPVPEVTPPDDDDGGDGAPFADDGDGGVDGE